MSAPPTVIDWFAGIGSARLAFQRAGWDCVWSCERDRDARRIYATHFGAEPPGADITDIRAADVPAADCWVAGFPCQDLSVAGRGAGFGGHRSSLVFRLLDLATELRPPWLVLENVPGLLSVRGGRDFGTLLLALEDAGYVGAWRVLDARWFGVPQRRRRVFLVARRAGAAGPDPSEVLFEPEGMRGGAAARGTPGQDVARPLGAGTPRSSRVDLDHGALVTGTLTHGSGGGRYDKQPHVVTAPVTSKWHKRTGGPAGDKCQNLVAATVRASDGHHGRSSPRGDGCDNLVIAETVRSHPRPGSNSLGQLVADPISAHEGKTYSHEGRNNFRLRNVVCLHADAVGRSGESLTPSPDAEGRVRLRDAGMGITEDATFALTTNLPHAIAFDMQQVTHPENRTRIEPRPDAPACAATNRLMVASVALRGRTGGNAVELREDGTANALRDGGAGGSSAPMVLTLAIRTAAGGANGMGIAETVDTTTPEAVHDRSGIRRLTPRECERLQGLDDDWTAGHADTVRYRCIGNAMAVPVVEWIAARLLRVLRKD